MEQKFVQKKIEDSLIDSMEAKFKEKVDTFILSEIKDTKNVNFSIETEFYNSFILSFHFNNGEIYFSINNYNETEGFRLPNSQDRYENLDMEKFLNELETEIELRIPDEFLKSKGWLK